MRLEQVRKTKLYLYLVQLVVVLAATVLLVALGGGFSLSPFYIPTGSFVYFLILMGLVFVAEGAFFLIFEVRFTKSQSSKFYMIKKAIRRAYILIAVCAFVAVFMLTPFLNNIIANYASESGTTSSTASFFNRDPLGLTSVDSVKVSTVSPCEVLIMSEAYYEIYKGNLESMRSFSLSHRILEANGQLDIPFPTAENGEYVLVAIGGEVSYTVHKVLYPVFTSYVAVFALIFIAASAGWIAYLMPKKKKLSKGAIYR